LIAFQDVYFTNYKNELFDKFKIFQARVKNQLERKIKILLYDRGGECSNEIDYFLELHGIIHQVILFLFITV